MQKMRRKDLEQSYRASDDALTRTRIALHEVLLGNVHWIRMNGKKVGLIRPDSACGGIIIVMNGDPAFPNVHLLEDWASEMNRLAISIGREYHEWAEIAMAAITARNTALKAA